MNWSSLSTWGLVYAGLLVTVIVSRIQDQVIRLRTVRLIIFAVNGLAVGELLIYLIWGNR